jgi:O-antigen/teichoic acid export membrane protein
MIPVSIPLIQNIGIEIQRAKNKHKFRSVIYLLIAVSNIFISIPLIRLWGGAGAAAGTAISLAVGNIIVMNIYYHYRVGIDILYFWKQILFILPGLILPTVFGSVFLFWTGNHMTWFRFAAGIIGYVIVFAVSVWFMSMNPYEKKLIRGIIPSRRMAG